MSEQKEGEWKYDYDFLQQLTEQVETDFEEPVSMEQVEAVLSAINYPAQLSATNTGKGGVWVKASDRKPKFGESVFVKMEWDSGKPIGAFLKRVNEDDCEWRTADDNSELSYSLNVIEWLDETSSLVSVGDGWIRVEDGLPVRPEKKMYENVQCGYYTPKGKFIQFVGFYAEKHKVPYEDYDGDDGEYDPVEEANGTLYLKPGWYELEETPSGAYDEVFVERKVTHWQPLPPPPVEQKLNQ